MLPRIFVLQTNTRIPMICCYSRQNLKRGFGATCSHEKLFFSFLFLSAENSRDHTAFALYDLFGAARRVWAACRSRNTDRAVFMGVDQMDVCKQKSQMTLDERVIITTTPHAWAIECVHMAGSRSIVDVWRRRCTRCGKVDWTKR